MRTESIWYVRLLFDSWAWLMVPSSLLWIVQLRQAAGAVAHMHDVEIIHGDIKANNILMTANGRVFICDFGLAQISELQGVPGAYSSAECGNARWASPELLDGGERTFESDIWAFGMTIYQVRSCVIFVNKSHNGGC
jgi:serine/threonine protein kinase